MAANNPHNIQAAFFDVDGTLVSFTTHQVPESTKEALRLLRKAGIPTFVSTGRPGYELAALEGCEFEGFVTFNGQYCYKDGEVLYRRPCDPSDVAAIVGQVRSGLYQASFQQEDRLYVSGHDARVIKNEKLVGMTFPEDDPANALENDVYQMCVFLAPEDDDVVLDATENLKMTRWTPIFADVMPKGGGKAKGVLKMLHLYGIDPENALAFGDGGNDLGMFGVVGTSVSMGNGNPEVREQADHITDDVDADGIYNACRRLGLF